MSLFVRSILHRAAALLSMSLSLAAISVPAPAAHPPATGSPHPATAPSQPPVKKQAAVRPGQRKLDLSGRTRIGHASIYARRFAGQKMADGSRMSLHADNAASKTLPLGTRAKVTNLRTGKSAVVTIQDRGPYAKGRIVDLSPSTARKVGLTHEEGVARVAVAPILVPMPDGSLKRGDAAFD